MNTHLLTATTAAALLLARAAVAAPSMKVTGSADGPATVLLAAPGRTCAIAVDKDDYPVVALAANLLADDIQRVTGQRPAVGNAPGGAAGLVVAGTLGHSALVDGLAAAGKLPGLDGIKGRWETTLWQTVERPFPGVERALVVVGSDRRGTAYGLTQLSERIGVSPWYWWADAPVAHRDSLAINVASPQTDGPAVQYRGIFINDEDWGFAPWAKSLDPERKIVGPKVYEKVFELLLRLRLNYLWPAMHACSTEFGTIPENVQLADRYAIVAGASHCEQMLRNNILWDKKKDGPWDYGKNRQTIQNYWEESVRARGYAEGVWTLGLRGVHDQPLQGSNEMAGKVKLTADAIADQRALLAQHVTKEWGPVSQLFCAYKEVQPIYQAGLEVPPDVTLVWADDNFGYMRRFSTPTERQRPGGSGFYYHLSYWGQPKGYLWLCTTPPAQMWLEMRKGWENDARRLWVVNVGDIKPTEINVDYLARLAWNPEDFGPDSQPGFLRDFAARNIAPGVAQPVADLLAAYYRLGTMRKPEEMNRAWATGMTDEQAAKLEGSYRGLLQQEETVAAQVPLEGRDAYTETGGFPARIVAAAGLVFLSDRKVQQGGVDAEKNQVETTRWRDFIAAQVKGYNQELAGGKWRGMMPAGEGGLLWSSQMRWPWNEKNGSTAEVNPDWKNLPPAGQTWRDAATADRRSAPGQSSARWADTPGLGRTGRAVSLQPMTMENSFVQSGGKGGPTLEYDFHLEGGTVEAFIDFLPTFRLVPGTKLRVAVSVDSGFAQTVEVPGSDTDEDPGEYEQKWPNPVRRYAVMDNCARVRLPLPPDLRAGKHTFKITALDPGVVIDRVSLP